MRRKRFLKTFKISLAILAPLLGIGGCFAGLGDAMIGMGDGPMRRRDATPDVVRLATTFPLPFNSAAAWIGN